MWTYVQRTGQLSRDGGYVATGYSGYDDPDTGQQGKNHPGLEDVADVGPIPVGNTPSAHPWIR